MRLTIATVITSAILAACTTPRIDLETAESAPRCYAEYELAAPSGLAPEQTDAIVETALSVTGQFLQQHIDDVAKGASAAYGGIGFGRFADGPPELQVIYLMPCSEISEASARLLAAVHNDRAVSPLLGDARFVLVSQDEKSFRTKVVGEETGSQQ
jgi:hypothetical protein